MSMGEKLNVTDRYLNLHPLYRNVLAAVITTVIMTSTGSAFYFDLKHQVDQTSNAQGEVKKDLKAVKDAIGNVQVEQRVLKQRFEDKLDNDEKFQERTDRALERIQRALDRQNRNGTGDWPR